MSTQTATTVEVPKVGTPTVIPDPPAEVKELETSQVTEEMLSSDLFLHNIVLQVIETQKKGVVVACRIISEDYDVPYVTVKRAYNVIEEGLERDDRKAKKEEAKKHTTPKPYPQFMKDVSDSVFAVRGALSKLESAMRPMWQSIQEWETSLKEREALLDAREAAVLKREQDMEVVMDNTTYCPL